MFDKNKYEESLKYTQMVDVSKINPNNKKLDLAVLLKYARTKK